MTWADHVDNAMQRGNSPYTASDVLRWLRDGKAWFGVAGKMSGSLWFKPGECEVGHVAGEFNPHDMQWLIDQGLSEARARGYKEITLRGRAGWQRMFRRHGIRDRGINYVSGR